MLKVRQKIFEALFFLELLRKIQENGPLTNRNIDEEATYLTSAILNCCYSIVEQLEKQVKCELRILKPANQKLIEKELEAQKREIFRSNRVLYTEETVNGRKVYGWRHLSVHHESVPVKAENTGGWGKGVWGERAWGSVKTTFYAKNPITNDRIEIFPLFKNHIMQLDQLIDQWERKISEIK